MIQAKKVYISVFASLLIFGCHAAPPPTPPQPLPELAIRSAELDGPELLAALENVSRIAKEQREGALLAICKLASHPDHLLRIRAIKSLSEPPYLKTPEAYAAFVAALDDPHWLVRSYGARGLALTERPEAALVLEAKMATEIDSRTKHRMEEALTKIRLLPPGTVPDASTLTPNTAVK